MSNCTYTYKGQDYTARELVEVLNGLNSVYASTNQLSNEEILNRVIKGFNLQHFPQGFGTAFKSKSGKASRELAKSINKWIKDNDLSNSIVFAYESTYATVNFIIKKNNASNNNFSKQKPDVNIQTKYFESGNTQSITDILTKISVSTHPLASLASKLLEINANTNVEIILDDVEYYSSKDIKFAVDIDRAKAYYQPVDNKIHIAKNANFNNGFSETTLLHEIIHAMTRESFRTLKSSNSIDAFTELYNHAINTTLNKELYGYSNLDEFIVGIFTDSRLIKDLKNIPALNDKKYDNLFQEIYYKLLELIGLKDTNNAYKQAFALASNIITEEQDYVKHEYEYTTEEYDYNDYFNASPIENINNKEEVDFVFEQNPELANSVYEVLGFNNDINNRLTVSQEGSDGFGYVLGLFNGKSERIGKIVYRNKTYLKDKGFPNVNELHLGFEEDYQGKGYFQDALIELLKYDDLPIFISNGRVINNNVFKAINKLDTSKLNINKIQDGYIITLNNEITPEQKQQALQLYSQYLDTIFPDSKVKDIVYHGTDNDNFQSFYNRRDSGIHFGTLKAAQERRTQTDFEFKNKYKFISSILNLKNPLKTNKDFNFERENLEFENNPDWDYTTDTSYRLLETYLHKLGLKTSDENGGIPNDEVLKNAGYDGLIYKNEKEDVGKYSYAVFEPKQIHILGSKQDIEGFKNFVKGKQFQKLTVEEKARTIEQVTKEHRSITALKDLSAKLAHRIGGKIEFENKTDVNWKGYNQGNTSVFNEAYMTPDTPFHEILGHPIIRVIKEGYYIPNYVESEIEITKKLINKEITKEQAKELRENRKVKTGNNKLYQSLLKELETGRGKEVFEQVKRDYKYKLDFPENLTEQEQIELINDLGLDFRVKYTLEEQQEEAIVTLLGLMAADKLDAKKDATLISKLKELWKQISDFVKSLLRQDGIKIDELPITTTLNDLAEIMAYGNNKIILPGYKVEYSTPLGNKYDTLEEVNNEIRGLADSSVEVDLMDVKITKEYTKIPKEITKFRLSSDVGQENFYTLKNNKWEVETEYDTYEISDIQALEAFKLSNKGINHIDNFIEKNKEYEQSKEIIEQWKKENNIQYDPEEVYSRGQGFYSSIGAYSNLELDLLLKNLIQHIEDNKKAGGEFTISTFTKPIDKRLKHIEGTGDRVRFVIYPKSEHIKWAAPTDVYSGSVWDAHEKVSKDKKSELLGVSFTKSPALRNINEVSPNLANVIDNLSHAHNELGIELTTDNFRIEYDDNIDYSTKKLIDNINKILDDKYGKIVKPKIEKKINNLVFAALGEYNQKRNNSIVKEFKTKKEALSWIEDNKIEYERITGSELQLGEFWDEGKQPTQTKENTTSIESVKNKISGNKILIPDSSSSTGFRDEFGNDVSLTEKDYTSQALTNLKVAALKEVARKYPRNLITSKVVPINPNMVDNSEIQYSKNDIFLTITPTIEEEEDGDYFFNPDNFNTITNNNIPKGELVYYRGLKEQMLTNINGKIVDVKKQLKDNTNKSVLRTKLSELIKKLEEKKEELEKEIAELKKDQEKTTFVLAPYITRDLERAEELSQSNDANDVIEAAEIVRFIKAMSETAPNTTREFAYGMHPIFTEEELAYVTEDEKIILDEWKRRAIQIEEKISNSNDRILEDLVNSIPTIQKMYGKKLTAKDLQQNLKDIDLLSMYMMGIQKGMFSDVGKLPQVSHIVLTKALENAQAKYRTYLDKIERLTPLVEAEMKKQGFINKKFGMTSPDYSIFFEQDEDGLFGQGMNLVSMFSFEYNASFEQMKKDSTKAYYDSQKETDKVKKSELIKKNNDAKKKWIKTNTIQFNPSLISSIINEPRYSPFAHNFTNTPIAIKDHEDKLKSLLGEHEYNRGVARLKEILDDFLEYRKNLIADLLQKENVTDYRDLSQQSIAEIKNFDKRESPFYAVKVIERNDYDWKLTSTGNYPVYPNFNSLVMIPKNEFLYNQKYRKIHQNPILTEFYELSRNISETMRSIFPTEIQNQLLETSLNYVGRTAKDIMLRDDGSFFFKVFKIIRKMVYDIIQIFGTNESNNMSYAHYDFINGEANYEVNKSFITKNLAKIKEIKTLEIAKFRAISNLDKLNKVKIKNLNQDSLNYIKKIIGKIPHPDEEWNIYDFLEKYAKHQMVMKSTMNLPKMLKLYANLTTMYEGKQQALPLLRNIKNHFEQLKNIATNNNQEEVTVAQSGLLKTKGKRHRALTQYESWMNRKVLDNTGNTGIFGKVKKTNTIKKEEETSKKTINLLSSALFFIKRVKTEDERLNIYEINKILKTIPKRTINNIIDNLNIKNNFTSEEKELYKQVIVAASKPKQKRDLQENQLLADNPVLLNVYITLSANKGITDLIEYKYNTGRTYSISSFLGALNKFIVLKMMALNISSAGTNFIEGQISNNLLAARGDLFNPDNLGTITAIDIITAGVIRRTTQAVRGKNYAEGKMFEDVWKLEKIIERYDIFADIANEIQKTDGESLFNTGLSKVLMSPSRYTEYLNQAPLIAAILKDVMVEGIENGQPVKTHLLDAMERVNTAEGHILRLKAPYDNVQNRAAWLRDYSNLNQLDAERYSQPYIETKTRIDEIIESGHGGYKSGMMIKENQVGQAIMSLKTWLPRQISARFAPEHDDIMLGIVGKKGFYRSHTTATSAIVGALSGTLMYGGWVGTGLAIGFAGLNKVGLMGVDKLNIDKGSWGASSSLNLLMDLAISTQIILKKMIGLPINSIAIFSKALRIQKKSQWINTNNPTAIIYKDGWKKVNTNDELYTLMKGDRFTEEDFKNFRMNLQDIYHMLLMYGLYFAGQVLYYSEEEPDETMTQEEIDKIEKDKAANHLLVNQAIQLAAQASSYYSPYEIANQFSPEHIGAMRFLYKDLPNFVKAAGDRIINGKEADIQTQGINRGKSKTVTEFKKTFLPSIVKDPFALGFKSKMDRQWQKAKLDELFWSDEKTSEQSLKQLRTIRKQELVEFYTNEGYTTVQSEKMADKIIRREIPSKKKYQTYEQLYNEVKPED